MKRIAEIHTAKPWRRVTDWAACGGVAVTLFLTFNPAPAIWVVHLLR